MNPRLNFFAASPRTMEILVEQENNFSQQFTGNHTVTKTTWELVKLRVSQINQCAYCIDMHGKDALKCGETPERIYGLSAWLEMPFYTVLERRALQWAELISAGKPVADEDYRLSLETFGDQGLVDLTVAVNAINSWNRIAKAFKPEVGSYQPGT